MAARTIHPNPTQSQKTLYQSGLNLINRFVYTLRRYTAVYAALWKASLTREIMFKVNFLLWVVVELVWFGLQVAFVSVLYLHTEEIGSWTKWQVMLLVGVAQFIQQIFQALFLINCANLSDLVRTGKLDFVLLMPVNSRFLVSLRQVDPSSLVNALVALGVMGYALAQLHIKITVANLALFLMLCTVGILIHYSLMFILGAVSFWMTRSEGLVWVYYNMFQIARLPDEAFRGVMKVIFTFVVPMLLVANVPTRTLAHTLHSPLYLLLMLGCALVCFWASSLVWKSAIKRYSSASS